MKRKLILVSMPDSFAKKFVSMVHNLNSVNESQVRIDQIYDEKKPEAVVINDSHTV